MFSCLETAQEKFGGVRMLAVIEKRQDCRGDKNTKGFRTTTWKTIWRFLKELGSDLPYDPAIPGVNFWVFLGP